MDDTPHHSVWMPVGPGPVRMPAGVHWDAIRAPLVHVWSVLDRLERAPAIIQPGARTLTWLVPVASVTCSDVPAAVTLIRSGDEVDIPPATALRTLRTAPPPLHWTAPPLDRPVVDPPTRLVRWLRDAIPGGGHGC